MSPGRGASVLAWSLFSLWALIAAATLWVGSTEPGNRDSIFPLLAGGYSLAGALVASRHPDNAVGWLLLVIPLTVGLQIGGETYVIRHYPGYVGVAWVAGWLFNVWFYLVVAFLPLIFPTGRLLSRRWRFAWWFAVATLVTGVVDVALKPGNLAVNSPVENPLGVHGTAQSVVEAVDRWVLTASVLSVLFSALSIVTRFRRADGVERQQLKWFATAVLLAVGGLILASLVQFWTSPLGSRLDELAWTLFIFSCVVGIPVATGIAILRYRLYDIDVVINRTLVYGSLTAVLAATYVVSILLLHVVLSPLTGKSDLAVAVSTLAVAAAFRPARARIQELVDRRFYRHRYDAVHTLGEFATRLRHEVDLDAVGADLLTTAARTMQPAHVSLWLRKEGS